MGANITVGRWGNSAGIRIPKVVMDRANLKLGDSVTFRLENGEIILTPHPIRGKYTLADILPSTPVKQKEIDWGKPVGKEIW